MGITPGGGNRGAQERDGCIVIKSIEREENLETVLHWQSIQMKYIDYNSYLN